MRKDFVNKNEMNTYPYCLLYFESQTGRIQQGLVVTMPDSQARGRKFESLLDPHMQVGLVAI